MDNNKEAIKIKECFGLADQIIKVKENNEKIFSNSLLMIVVSDTYFSYWSPDWKIEMVKSRRWEHNTPQQVLTDALNWLSGQI